MKIKSYLIFTLLLMSGRLCFADNLLTLFRKAEVTKDQLASCFENPLIEENSISSKGEGFEINIVTIAFIDGRFVQGWITFKNEILSESSETKIDASIGMRLNVERLLSIYGFKFLSQVIDNTPDSIGEKTDLWVNNYWQFAIRPTEYGVEIYAAPIAVWYDTLLKLEKSLSR